MTFFRRGAANALDVDGEPVRNHPYRQPGSTMNIQLSDEEKTDGQVGVDAFIDKWFLDRSSQVEITQTAKKRTDSNPNTLMEYKRVWRECYLFSVRLGDWRTATLMSDNRPRNPLPALPKTIRYYWMWKCTPKGDPVQERSQSHKNKREGAALTWGDGTVMYGCGAWSSPGCLIKSHTALDLLHDCHTNLKYAFVEECRACSSLNPGLDLSKGIVGSSLPACPDHVNTPVVKPRGNAMSDKTVKNEMTSLKQELNDTHNPKGNFQLTPSQIREIRRELLKGSKKGSVQTIAGAQLYLMMIMGIILFGRSDDVCTIKLGDFPPCHGNVGIDPFTVRYVSIYFLGKNRKQYTLLRLFRDDICPEFCPVRHLLTYLHITGIEGVGSFLFPKLKDLKVHVAERETNSNLKKQFDAHVPYANFKDRMKVSCKLTIAPILSVLLYTNCTLPARTQSIIVKVLQKNSEYDEEKMTVGTHTLRKTGFLFAVFGVLTEYNTTGRRSRAGHTRIQPMDDVAICLSARHNVTTKTHAYYQDAMTRFVEYQLDPQLAEENRVAPWKANFVQHDTTRKTLRLDGKYDESVEKLSDDYAKKELKVNAKNVTYAQLILLAVKTNLNRKSENEEFDELTLKLSATEKQKLEKHFDRRCATFRLHFAGAVEDQGGDDGE